MMMKPKVGTAARDEPQLGRLTSDVNHHQHRQMHQGLVTTNKSTQDTPQEPAESMISNDKNLMPSMVVKQQRGHLTKAQIHHQQVSEHSSNEEAQTTQLDNILHRTRAAAAAAATNAESCGRSGGQMFDQDGLVLPRRVPHHHQQGDGQQPTTIRDLNRELKFNQARGLPLLDQKSELKRAMEKLESSRRKKEIEHERLTRRTSLELRLEERAQRIARESGDGQPTESGILS
uniref:Uncharacterized protein n=1 Tax=Aceria tosichella TaxID=561515 RepID=A0A6G1S7F8_9ACAR